MRSSRSSKPMAVAASALVPFVGDVSGNERVLVEGDPVQLTPKRALALGMGFHEMATNAVKYGSLTSEEGLVEIRWRDIGEGILCITWVEKKGPTVAPPSGKGFGTRLLEQGLAHELDGTERLLHDPGGLICEIKMPMPETIS